MTFAALDCYALHGSSGWNDDVEYAWNRRMGINGVTDVLDITPDIATLLAKLP